MGKKTGKIVVPTEPTNPPAKITGFTFKSYDKNAGFLQFQIKNQDGSPTDLIDATVRLFMYIYQGEEKKEFPIFDNQIITESFMQGIVKYPIPDMLLAYEGKVDANVYIDFPDGSHTDNLAFTFTIAKSVIDGDVQLNGEYYFKDFQQLLDGVKQEAADAVNAALKDVDSTIEKANQQISVFVTESAEKIDQTVSVLTEELKNTQTKVNTVSQNVTSAQTDLTALEDRIDQTNQQIGDLGKLKKMYANSIDFGDYDYSGNPNLMPYITDPWTGSLLANGATIQENRTLKHTKTRATDDGDVLSLGFGIPRTTAANNSYLINGLAPSTKYSITVKINVGEDWTGGTETIGIRLRYLNSSGGTEIPVTAMLSTGLERNKFHTLTATGTTKADLTGMSNCYIQVFSTKAEYLGTVIVDYDIKLEKGDPSPYQPNLLEAPYYLSKVPLRENIASKSVAFPIVTSDYKLYGAQIQNDWEAGQTYTVTLKGTKPSTQSFSGYLNSGTIGVGSLTPVEGKTDIWQKTFTVTQAHIDGGVTNLLSVYQVPKETAGACRIEWLKLEKGDTATPNLSMFQYFGEGLKDSNNPKDYVWDITPEYAEKTMSNAVSLTDPQSVEGLKNFKDGLQVNGKNILPIEDTGWVNLTANTGYSWGKQAQVRKIGKHVMWRGSLTGTTTLGDITSLPAGFEPGGGYEMQFDLPCQSQDAAKTARIYVRTNGTVGLIASTSSTSNIFLSGISYFVE